MTVGSGIRYDLFMVAPQAERLLTKLIQFHVSGQLKIAPEHSDQKVLQAMRKTALFPLFDFVKLYNSLNQKLKKEQHLIPYLMSCHPGSGNLEMKEMKKEMRSIFKFLPKQVQAFIPLPMTLSSVIYYTGVDPLTGEKFFVEKKMRGRRKQHSLFSTK